MLRCLHRLGWSTFQITDSAAWWKMIHWSTAEMNWWITIILLCCPPDTLHHSFLFFKKKNLCFRPYPLALCREVQKVHPLFQLYDHYTCCVNMSAFPTTTVAAAKDIQNPTATLTPEWFDGSHAAQPRSTANVARMWRENCAWTKK